MGESLRHHLRLYLRLLGAQARSQFTYPLSFALDALAALLLTLTEFAAFALVLPRFQSLGGWTLGEVALLYGLAELAFVVMDLLFGGFDAPNLSGHIRTGSFDRFLLRPAPLTLQVFGSDFALRRVTRVLLGAVILGVGMVLCGVDWTLARVLLLALSGLGIFLFFGGLFVIGGTLTFWTVEGLEVMNVVTYGGRSLISYPMSIYAEWLRRLFTFVLPAAFLTYFPALALLGRPFPEPFGPWAAWCAPLAGALVLGVAFAFWRVGLRHYQGTGS